LFEAKFKESTNQWILNGEKSFVLMPPDHKNSTMFMVVASTESVDHVGDYEETITVFLVDGSLPGVKISKVEDTIGFGEKAFKQVTVAFEDVAVEKCEFKQRFSRIPLIYFNFSYGYQ
jgi:alkylation response protein AidB-like acyl-CoA dehydrogenase